MIIIVGIFLLYGLMNDNITVQNIATIIRDTVIVASFEAHYMADTAIQLTVFYLVKSMQ